MVGAMARRTLRRRFSRQTLLSVALLSAMAALLSFFASLAGFSRFNGNWNGPLAVELRGGPFFVQHAWVYLVPAIVVATAASIALFGSLVILVTRDGRER